MDPDTTVHLAAIGINYGTAPVAVRERFSGDREHAHRMMADLAALIPELTFLGTCNRSEWILHGTLAQIAAVAAAIRQLGGLSEARFAECFYQHLDRTALTHLCRLSAGLDSMVLGEPQILGQAKEAMRFALEHGYAGRRLHAVFQHAFYVAKEVRRETKLGEGALSLGSLAVQLARQQQADLARCRVLLVGAGEMSRLVGQHFHKNGARDLRILNRSVERAHLLAQDLQGEGDSLAALPEALVWADVIISSTACPDYVITAAAVQQACTQRRARPLCLIDLAVPRDVDPAVAALPGTRLLNLDQLAGQLEQNRAGRAAEIPRAEALIQDLLRAPSPLDAPAIGAVIGTLKERTTAVRDLELERLFRRHDQWSEEERQEISHCLERVIRKVLHAPIKALHDPDQQGPQALANFRQLFGLDGQSTPAPAAIRPPITEEVPS